MSKVQITVEKNLPKLVSIKVAADILGLSPTTLRHWDKNKKLVPIRKTNNYRFYKISDLLKIIRNSKKIGQINFQKKKLIDN